MPWRFFSDPTAPWENDVVKPLGDSPSTTARALPALLAVLVGAVFGVGGGFLALDLAVVFGVRVLIVLAVACVVLIGLAVYAVRRS